MRGERCVSESDAPFEPPIALASLSGQSDAQWAKAGADYAGVAFLGGIAIDEPTREAALEMVERDRTEFLPPDPVAYIDDQLAELASVPIQPGFNVRTTSLGPLAEVAEVCREHESILEINAHCRQKEICGVGAGEALLTETERLREQVNTASERGVDVSVKVRAEVDGVELTSLSRELERSGASFLHVDAMDSEHVVADVAATTGMTVIANNGIRDRETAFEYLEYGADAVSVGRPSDDPRVLSRVLAATEEWFGDEPGDEVDHRIGDNTEEAATQNHGERP